MHDRLSVSLAVSEKAGIKAGKNSDIFWFFV